MITKYEFRERIDAFNPNEFAFGKMAKKYRTIPPKLLSRRIKRISETITKIVIWNGVCEELERAVKYSKVLIDANKDRLDYSRAYEIFDIDDLIEEYRPLTLWDKIGDWFFALWYGR